MVLVERLDEIARYYAPVQNKAGPATAHFYAACSNLIDRVIVAAFSLGL